MNVLDCRGLPCPEPVIRCRDWLATVNGAVLEVLVDNPAAVENVSVFLSGRGWTVDSRREGDAVWRLSAVRDEAAASSSIYTRAILKLNLHAEPCCIVCPYMQVYWVVFSIRVFFHTGMLDTMFHLLPQHTVHAERTF